MASLRSVSEMEPYLIYAPDDPLHRVKRTRGYSVVVALAPQSGAYADVADKRPVEVALVGEPQLGGNVPKALPRIGHQFPGPLDTAAHEPIIGRRAKGAFERTDKHTIGQSARVGHVLHADRCIQMVTHIRHRRLTFLDREARGSRRRVDLFATIACGQASTHRLED